MSRVVLHLFLSPTLSWFILVSPCLFAFCHLMLVCIAGEPFACERERRRPCQGGGLRVCTKVHAGERIDDAVRDPRLCGARDSLAQVSHEL